MKTGKFQLFRGCSGKFCKLVLELPFKPDEIHNVKYIHCSIEFLDKIFENIRIYEKTFGKEESLHQDQKNREQ